MRPRIKPDDRSRIAEHGSPDGPVRRWSDGVKGGIDPLVLRGIDRVVRLDVRVALAVAIGIENERRPTLRRYFVAGLQIFFRVQPADDGTTAARPKRIVRVLGEHQVMRAEARADVRILLGFRIVHSELATRAVERK